MELKWRRTLVLALATEFPKASWIFAVKQMGNFPPNGDWAPSPQSVRGWPQSQVALVTTHRTFLILTIWQIHFPNVIQVMNTLERTWICPWLFCEHKQSWVCLRNCWEQLNRALLEKKNWLEQKTSIWTFSWCSAYLFQSRIFKFVNQVKLKMQKWCGIWILHYML